MIMYILEINYPSNSRSLDCDKLRETSIKKVGRTPYHISDRLSKNHKGVMLWGFHRRKKFVSATIRLLISLREDKKVKCYINCCFSSFRVLANKYKELERKEMREKIEEITDALVISDRQFLGK